MASCFIWRSSFQSNEKHQIQGSVWPLSRWTNRVDGGFWLRGSANGRQLTVETPCGVQSISSRSPPGVMFSLYEQRLIDLDLPRWGHISKTSVSPPRISP